MAQEFEKSTFEFVSKVSKESIVPTLEEYIRIPNQSPMFDANWRENGELLKAAKLFLNYAKNQKGFESAEIVTLQDPQGKDRTPVIFIDIPSTDANCKDTVLLYGHLDKQPPLRPWAEGLDPYTPVIRDGKLYGRGSSDDGYAMFGAITAITNLRHQGLHHSRCVVLIEACEESGSPDLPYYIDHLEKRIGTPSLIICLDSGCGNYEQMWLTTSLRGLIAGNLKVEILNEAVHSGLGSGIVPSSFRIVRKLLSRIENEDTGDIIPKFLHVDIPKDRIVQAEKQADTLGLSIIKDFPLVSGATAVLTPTESNKHEVLTQLLLNRAWRPTLCVTGIHGIAPLESASNIVRTQTTLKLSIRVPAMLNAEDAAVQLKKLLEENPPYGAKVTFTIEKSGDGWSAPTLSPWLEKSLETASSTFYKKSCNFSGEGGSIPFMGMLGKKFPKAQFVITGLLGPQSNAHGPNEFLHIDYMNRLICCVSKILADQYHHPHNN